MCKFPSERAVTVSKDAPLHGWREFYWRDQQLKSLYNNGPRNTWAMTAAIADRAPTHSNTNGLHAYDGRVGANREPTYTAYANVIAWGKCRVGVGGFRAEHMEVVEICVGDTPMAAKVRRSYPTLPIFIKTRGKSVFTPYDPPKATAGAPVTRSRRTVIGVI